MDKIYRRSTMISRTEPKERDESRRARPFTIAFRVSAEERAMIEERIRMSGLPKGEFYIQSSLNQRITATGNVKTFDEIRRQMETIDRHLCSLQSVDELDPVILSSLRTILEILDGLYGGTQTQGGGDIED